MMDDIQTIGSPIYSFVTEHQDVDLKSAKTLETRGMVIVDRGQPLE